MPHIDEATLRQLYLDEQLRIEQIARALKVRKQTVCALLKQYDISLRPRPLRSQIPQGMDTATLRQLYEEERWTIRGLAEQYQVSFRTIRTALIEAGIPLRKQTWRRDRFAAPPDIVAAIKVRVAACGVPQTARLLHITPQKIYALMGEQPRWRGTRRRLDDEAVRAAYEGGMSAAELAGAWQCSTRAIQRSLQRTYVRPGDETPVPPGTSLDQNDAKPHETASSEV